VSAFSGPGKVPLSGIRRTLLTLPAVVATVAALSFTAAGPALAAPASSVHKAAASRVVLPTRIRALDWAKSQYGKPYIYGGTGPRGYDCSGLVMMAYRHAGISLPRTTYEMLRSRHLVRVAHPLKGDLAFYGTGHVEMYAHGDWTYGAHAPGQIIGWIRFGPWWHPTAYYRVR
jgi:cell wall-associated NlpC family hydrolase